MKLNNTLMMAALSLLSALTVQAANIKISSLPFVISAPGTYVLTGNLVCANPEISAITINSPVAGSIVLDLKGYTISCITPGVSSGSVGISISGNLVGGSITIR